MAATVVAAMQDKGVNFLNRCNVTAVEKQADEKLLVKWVNDKKEEFSDTYDTILFAMGRKALTRDLHLDKLGIPIHGESDKIDAVNEQTNVPHIFAVGDVLLVSSV